MTLGDGEKWTIAQIFEHIAAVQEGMTKISSKLLKKAEKSGQTANGEAVLSENFQRKAVEAQQTKFQAPEELHPQGNVSIADSLAKMAETRRILDDLRPLFETVECSEFKFPHPFMGDLSAHEWLTLIGGHEARHLKQIGGMLEKNAA